MLPRFRFKEIQNFVGAGLKDFSISRVKDKLPWGIDVPGDPSQVMYVWFDALINYISALGWPESQKQFIDYWGTHDKPNAIQVAGKDNLRQQTAIWQAMLLSAGLPNTKQILIHGFITANGQKISKSLGNVINPFEVVKKYGTDAVRYYLLKEIHPFNDGDFSYPRFEEIYNADLANGLGNLVQRISKLAENAELEKRSINLKTKYDYLSILEPLLNNFRFDEALIKIWVEIRKLDQFIDKTKPWEKSGNTLAELITMPINKLINISYLLRPFLPDTAKKIESIFTGEQIKAPSKALFPRL